MNAVTAIFKEPFVGERLQLFSLTLRTYWKVLNSGELTDSLAIRTETIPRLIERFGEQRKHKLLLLTKSDAVDSILNLNHNRQTIASFSLNSVEGAEKFEVGAPNPQKRLKAARKCGDAGYPVRVRVDPMLPHDCWEEAYDRLADEINELHPESVTLGTLRYFPIVKSYSRRDRVVFNFPTERSIDRRLRLTFTLRIKIYKHMLRRLKVREVSLCKETVDVVKTLGLPQKCNCVP
jgi:spore photoproduct lyase